MAAKLAVKAAELKRQKEEERRWAGKSQAMLLS